MEHPYFPLFVDLSEKNVLVVGAGHIASRRAAAILPFAGRVTVVAPEDWITPVTTAPVATATKRLAENILKMERIRSPATRCRPPLISFIPKIKMARPPITWITFIKFMRKSPKRINIW